MYKFNELNILDIEITSNCQASCPMCARNHHGGMENPLLEVKSISIDGFKTVCPVEFLQQLKTISFCGNYGDPILNKELVEMVEYAKETNPNLSIEVHTNGSARTTEWWIRLAKALPKNHLIHFALDGLEDTHHLHRIGTDFNKIIENAKAFIGAGGRARWVYITFKHNEHQLEEAREMSKELGFESFQEKQSSRFITEPWFDVLDREGNVTHRIESPTEQKLIFIDRKTVENYKQILGSATIDCQVKKSKSVYIDANGHLFPCCYTGAVPYIHIKPSQLVYNFQQDNRRTFFEMVERFGGMDFFNLYKHNIKDVIDSEAWQTIWGDILENNKMYMCARACGKFPKPVISQGRDQFLQLDNFNE
jgi:MoaA/NifB/PqqE/SkfB family radical SAM enzyme